MSKKRKQRARIKTFDIGDPRFIDFFKELSLDKSARATAIIGHTFLHGSLQKVLRKRFVENKDLFKKIDGFSFQRCIDLCFLIGSISLKEKSELNKLNEIRNIFAHELVNDFVNEKITKICSGLGLCRTLVSGFNFPFKTSREKYTSTVKCFIYTLATRELGTIRIEEHHAFSKENEGFSIKWKP